MILFVTPELASNFVSPRPAILYYAECGYICKLCMLYKTHAVIQAVWCTTCSCFSTCSPQ